MYFLAIVGDPDIKVGNWVPSYVLCRIKSNSPNRSGWRVVDINGKYKDTTKILVKTFKDKQFMIDFMSNFRTRKHQHKSKHFAYKNTKKFYPRGALCWFECDQHGKETGTVYFIKRVPDKSYKNMQDAGKQILQQELARTMSLKEVITETHDFIDIKNSNIKKKLQ